MSLRQNRHVLCEKPLAMSLHETETVVKVAQESSAVLIGSTPNRFRREMPGLKKHIECGSLGDIRVIRCGWLRRGGIPGATSWFTSREHSGGGALIDLGVHLLDLVFWLCGCRSIEVVASTLTYSNTQAQTSTWYRPVAGDPASGPFDVETGAIGKLRLAGGLRILIEVRWECDVRNDCTYLHIYGTARCSTLGIIVWLKPARASPQVPSADVAGASSGHSDSAALLIRTSPIVNKSTHLLIFYTIGPTNVRRPYKNSSL